MELHRRMIDRDVAEHATVGLVVMSGDTVGWLNEAGRALVVPHGGSWSGPGSPLAAMADIRPGSRWTAMRWPSPASGTRWWSVTCSALPAPAGQLLYEIIDQTARYDADGRDTGPPTAQWRLARLESMAGMGSWVWNIVDDRIEWSEALLVQFGMRAGTVLDFAAYRSLLHPEDVTWVVSALTEAMRSASTFTFIHRMFLLDGRTERTFECYGEVFTDAGGTPTRVLGTYRDITEHHRVQQELAFLAGHDPLTGIANRRGISGWLADSAADPRGATLLLLDIDNFKDINDLHGHAVGDRVIRRVAHAVQSCVGSEAKLGRLGGDEFAVVVPRIDDAAGMELGERICDVVGGTPVLDETAALRVTVSIGVSTLSPGQDVEAGLARADLALYEAKRAGRNRVRLFAPDQYHQAVRRVSLLQRVSDALDDGTMQLDAQPIVDLANGRTSRHELLLRLRDGLSPELGPAEFLPAAERTDLVMRVDRWVLRRAVQALASPAARARGLRFEVNVSARSLDDANFGRWVLDQLENAEVEPGQLGLEITETTAISSVNAARVLATQLIQAGCGFALDDFGAGFGSFSYLKNMPFTAVKIAGEFVRQLDHDPVDRALVAAVVGVAAQLGMRTVAEHVDRQALVDELRALGVDDGQGFQLGHPRPLERLLE